MPDPRADSFDSLAADAVSHHTAGRLSEAEAAYRTALELHPGSVAALQNLAAVLAAQHRHAEALPLLDAVLQQAPRYATAHYNRAATFEALCRTDDAIGSYRAAAAIEPSQYDAHLRLAFLYLAKGDRGRALDHFARTYELRRGDDHVTIANRSLTHTSRDKLLHDAEQFLYLAKRHRDARRFELLARAYRETAGRLPANGEVLLSDADRDLIGADYNTAITIFGAAELPDATITPTLDHRSVSRTLEHDGAAIIDGLLTPKAHERLRRFLLESTVWHDFTHIGGFVASYIEDGLASPLLLQIAGELRMRLDPLLADAPLVQAWAFKGLEPRSTVDLHADDAQLSLNLWLTPDAANSDTNSGGLVIYRAPLPDDWRIAGYTEDGARLQAFARENEQSAVTIPYRDNRAVLFRSRLVHGSDRPNFEAGYENHRINMTLLFGKSSN